MTGESAETEIDVTPEMIDAGAAVVFAGRDDLMAWTLAEQVYRAMVRARAAWARSEDEE